MLRGRARCPLRRFDAPGAQNQTQGSRDALVVASLQGFRFRVEG